MAPRRRPPAARNARRGCEAPPAARAAGRPLRARLRLIRAASGRAWAPAATLGAHREPLVAGGLLLATLFAIYVRLIFQGLVLAGYDVQTYFYPYWAYTFEALRAGRPPLWNPHLFMGAPFLANPQAAVFYLPNWPLLAFPPERALTLAVMLHVALAAGGAVALSRRALGLSWPAATTTAAVFAFGGFFAGQLGHVNQVSVVAWLPWLLLALDRVVTGSRRWWVVAPLLTALMLLAGHPQQAYIGFAFRAALRACGWRPPCQWQRCPPRLGARCGSCSRNLGAGRHGRRIARGRPAAADARTLTPLHPFGRA